MCIQAEKRHGGDPLAPLHALPSECRPPNTDAKFIFDTASAALSLLVIGFFYLLLPSTAPAQGNRVAVRAYAERQQVYMGEPFQFQIKVSGDEAPEEPQFSAVSDVTIEFQGGQTNSRTAVTIINGQMTKNEEKGYVFSYRIIAHRSGEVTVPSAAVRVQGKTLHTNPVTVEVRTPEPSDEFSLHVELSKSHVFVGEPVNLGVRWLLHRSVDEFEFSLPHLDDERFVVESIDETGQSQGKQNSLVIPVSGRRFIAQRTPVQTTKGRALAVSFSHILVPQEEGAFLLPQATVSCRAVEGYQRKQYNPFPDFFGDDFFFGNREPRYRRYVVPANRPRLEVLPLPTEGRPAYFGGLVGQYTILASAAPKKVQVGDPITVTIEVSGPRYLANVALPPLTAMEGFEENFSIPGEMGAGVIEDGVKRFSQTIRAAHASVNEIPPVVLPYFDPSDGGAYKTALSRAIPIEVKSGHRVTAADAEGMLRDTQGEAEDLEVHEGGIAANYYGEELLEARQTLRRFEKKSLILLFIVVPPLLFALLYGGHLLKRQMDARGRDGRGRVGKDTVRQLAGLRERDIPPEETAMAVLAILRKYIGVQAGLPADTVTRGEVEKYLHIQGVERSTCEALLHFMEAAERASFGGDSSVVRDRAAFLERAEQLIYALESFQAGKHRGEKHE